MDWRVAERAVVEKCEDLQESLNLYTANDNDECYNESELFKKLGGIKEAFRVGVKSIKEFLRDYDDSLSPQQKEYLNTQVTDNLELP